MNTKLNNLEYYLDKYDVFYYLKYNLEDHQSVIVTNCISPDIKHILNVLKINTQYVKSSVDGYIDIEHLNTIISKHVKYLIIQNPIFFSGKYLNIEDVYSFCSLHGIILIEFTEGPFYKDKIVTSKFKLLPKIIIDTRPISRSAHLLVSNLNWNVDLITDINQKNLFLNQKRRSYSISDIVVDLNKSLATHNLCFNEPDAGIRLISKYDKTLDISNISNFMFESFKINNQDYLILNLLSNKLIMV